MKKISEGRYVNGVPTRMMVALPIAIEKMLPNGKKIVRLESITRHIRLVEDVYIGRDLSGKFVQWGTLNRETKEVELSAPKFFKESIKIFEKLNKPRQMQAAA